MGIFSRFTDIINSNINAILDKAEDPRKIVRLMIQEMEDTLVEVRSAAARSIAEKKRLARAARTIEAEAGEWQAKAELALDRGRDDLAKAALREKASLSRSAEALREQGAAVDEGLERLNADVARLEEKLADAKLRQKAILARQETADRRLRVRRHIHDSRIDDALVRFEQFERRVDDMEGQVEAYDVGRPDLREAFSELESAEAVEEELRALKARRAAVAAADTERG